MNRRQFLQTSAGAGLALCAAMPASAPLVRGADKAGRKYRTAVVGTGWWGTNILREAIWSERCEVAALCDVDQAELQRCLGEVKKICSQTPRLYHPDHREMLQKEMPEVVIVATPDHWHPLIMIDAVKAGAHVYVEKPISHTVLEGRAMVKAARGADRVVQVGTHRRVSPHNVSGRKFIREGKAGKIGMVRAFVHYGGGKEEPAPNAEPPKGLDWDRWCGPAPLRPFNKKLHTRGWREFLDYANGTLGDWGVHWMDQIRWVLGVDAPRRVFSAGGRAIRGPAINDGKVQTTDAPDHLVAVFEFDGPQGQPLTVTWEHRQFAGNGAEKTHPQQPVGCYFYGTEGTLHVGWLDGWTFYPMDPKKAPVHQDAQLHEPDQQNIRELWADFLDAIENKRRPVSDIEDIHRSTTMALLGMLSLKLGRSVNWDGAKELFVGDEEANKLLRREYRGPWKYPEL